MTNPVEDVSGLIETARLYQNEWAPCDDLATDLALKLFGQLADALERLAAAPPAPQPSRGEREGLRMRCKPCGSPRSKSPCHKCGSELFMAADGWEEPAVPDIESIRLLAHDKGYALAVHGSLERDVDLIAVPWVDWAVSPLELAEHIAAALGGSVLAPENKPLGRWACNIQADGWFKLIDLSITPSLLPADPDPVKGELVEAAKEMVVQAEKNGCVRAKAPEDADVKWFSAIARLKEAVSAAASLAEGGSS